jgi:Coenzyme F420-dependent N5,N10-methylene tetrahydromethanopterin reductase and related flavin-dependent oxidoreductases
MRNWPSVGRKPRDVGILWSIRIQVAESEADANEKERRYLAAIRPEAGLVEMSAQYNVDFSKAGPACASPTLPTRCARRRETTEASRASQDDGSCQSVEEFGRRFLVDRILVATGTPKSIVDKLEEIHVASGANGGFILGRGYAAMDNIREFVELVVPELQRRGLSKKKYTGSTLRENLN